MAESEKTLSLAGVSEKQRSRAGARARVCWALAVALAAGGALALLGWQIHRAIPVQAPASIVQQTVQPDPVSVSVPATEPADPTLWSLLLANADNPLEEGYSPELVSVGPSPFGVEQMVDARIYDAWTDMLQAAREDGVLLQVRSAYRSHQTQTTLFENMVQSYLASGCTQEQAVAQTKKWRNVPGTSEHETGLAIDIVAVGYTGTLDDFLEQTPEAQWLYENAADYGFILRYPKDKTDITGTHFEPWHYRYVGVEDARKIMAAGLCLEEYLGQVPASSGLSASAG